MITRLDVVVRCIDTHNHIERLKIAASHKEAERVREYSCLVYAAGSAITNFRINKT